jgi:hypothetical protein
MIDANRPLLDLASDDLEVVEDGVPQQVEVFQEAVSPVSIVLRARHERQHAAQRSRGDGERPRLRRCAAAADPSR